MVASQTLVVTIGSRACAIPLSHVVETMRPLPIEPVAGAPPFVLGAAIVRGEPMPVVSLARLVGAVERDPARFVIVRGETRTLALAVDGVEGVATLDDAGLERMPALLGDASRDAALAIGARDRRLLVVLAATRVLSDARAGER